MATQLEDYSMYEDFSVLSTEEQNYISTLVEVYQAILPIPDGYEEKISASLNYAEIRDWKDRLEKVGEKFELLYLYLIKRGISPQAQVFQS